MAPTKRSPLPTDDLNDNAAWPFLHGANEIVIRVSSWNFDTGKPASYQAIVRGRDRTRLWGLGIRSNPVAALHRAIETFFDPKTTGLSNPEIADAELDARLAGGRDEPAPEPSIEDLLG